MRRRRHLNGDWLPHRLQCKTAQVYTNRDDLDFNSIGAMPPTQEWELQEVNTGGLLEYPTQ